MGATDSMWPKKRRILLRVLKAVAILRPRRFQGRKTPAAFSERPARQPVLPSVAEGHLSERTLGKSAQIRGLCCFSRPSRRFFSLRPRFFLSNPVASASSPFSASSPPLGREAGRGGYAPRLSPSPSLSP